MAGTISCRPSISGISDYVDKDGQPMVPSSVEAMVIVFVENNQDRWEWQSGVVKEHGNVKNFKEKLKREEDIV